MAPDKPAGAPGDREIESRSTAAVDHRHAGDALSAGDSLADPGRALQPPSCATCSSPATNEKFPVSRPTVEDVVDGKARYYVDCVI
jgi:hypothetical protein